MWYRSLSSHGTLVAAAALLLSSRMVAGVGDDEPQFHFHFAHPSWGDHRAGAAAGADGRTQGRRLVSE